MKMFHKIPDEEFAPSGLIWVSNPIIISNSPQRRI